MKRILLALLLLPAVAYASSSPSFPSDAFDATAHRRKSSHTTRGCEAAEKSNDWAAAQKQFEKALKYNEEFPQAHNNLAFVPLRTAGPAELRQLFGALQPPRDRPWPPAMPETYMYRAPSIS